MKQVILLISLLLVLVLTAGLVGGCKPSNKDSSGINSENSTDVEIDVNDIFGSSDTSDASGSDESSNYSNSSESSGSSSVSNDSSSDSQGSSSDDTSIDYEDPDSWTKPVKIPAKKS